MNIIKFISQNNVKSLDRYIFYIILTKEKGVIRIKAVIMAGGKGTRLRPLTCGIPKPMVPILNKPVMEYSINLLKKYEISDIAVTMAYLPTVITDYFADGYKWGVHLNYFNEEIPLGTGGSVKNAEDFLDDTFIVISGDALTDLDIKQAVKYHKMKKSKATLVLKKEPVPIEYGVVITDESGRIIRFLEKPSWGEVFSDTINTGIYILEPEVLNYYKKGDNFDFSKDLFPRLLKDNVPIFGYVTEDYWCDIGDVHSYKQTQFDILEGKVNLELDSIEIKKGIWIGEGSTVSSEVEIIPPVYIGKNCIIKNTKKIDAFTIIGNNCKIGKDTSLKRSILWKNTVIEDDAHCSGTTVCSNVVIKKGVNLYEDSVIGEGTVLSAGVIVKPDIKIWPHKKIEENTVINQNLVWGTKASKTIFGYRDISGDINIDITPEFASRLGASFASMMEEDSTIIVSSDDAKGSYLIKNSLISGVLSTGTGVVNISNTVIPMNRFAVRYYKANGGIHLRSDHTNINKIYIELVAKNGANIDRKIEREIEHLLNREDFERCNADKIKNVVNIDHFSSLYVKSGIDLLKNISKIKRENPKILIASKTENILRFTSDFLENIGCEVQFDRSMNQYKTMNEYLSWLAKKLHRQNIDFAVVVHENGENFILIDNKGRIIENEKYMAFVSLMTIKNDLKQKLVLPYIVPNKIENIAKSHNVEVILSKSNPSSMMNTMLSHENAQDNALFQYILNYHPIWGIGMIIDYLVGNGLKLSDLVDELPNFYFIKNEIACDWKHKGSVIREIIEENKGKNIELFEGVKILDDKGWALILPDSERPVFNIYTEGYSQEYAEELSLFFSDKVERLLKNQRE
ncbi:sugar phosphate nucleotidyltransferase [Anaerosolibacter carboniphilus]|nr:sugar phosphate nucleotidyltransferase [Anaerosolibacter carboniphilus]